MCVRNPYAMWLACVIVLLELEKGNSYMPVEIDSFSSLLYKKCLFKLKQNKTNENHLMAKLLGHCERYFCSS